MLADPLEFNGVAKHHVAACQHAAQRLARCGSLISPQILAVVDVETNSNAQFVGNVQCFEGGLGGLW